MSEPVETMKASSRRTGVSASGANAPFAELKTIFIITDSGMGIRNLLRTDVFRTLRACPNLQIVIFTPLVDENFRGEMSGENVFVEPLPQWKPGPIVSSLRSLRKDVWSEKFELPRFREKRGSLRSRLGRAFVFHLWERDRSAGRVDRAVEKIQRLENRLTPRLGGEYFDRYRPDLVLYTTLYSKFPALEIGAQQRGIPSCAYILSWDNPTTKGPFPVRPDRAVVWNRIMQEELIRFHGMPADHVFVSGPPQFDIYADREAYGAREDFFRKWNLDPHKKLITYTTGTPGLFPFEHETVEMLYRKVTAGAFKQPCQLMVRLHPKDIYDVYKRFENQPGLILQLPGRRGKTDDSWNPSREDMHELGQTILFSDVMVNIASTITIEAACFDKPVVNIAFDGFTEKPYEKSCRRIYDFDHYRNIVATGGVRLAGTIENTVEEIQRYLDDPSLENAGRARIRDEQCYRFDGKSGQRIGEYLIGLLKAK